MPTYEYECKKCGTVMELFQQITEAAKKQMDCPSCGRRQPVTRLIGAGGSLIFKGSGFYQTDYRSKGYKEAAKGESGGADKKEAPAAGSGGTGGSSAASTPAPAAKPAKPAKSSGSKS